MSSTNSSRSNFIHPHPLQQIAESGTHRLLLKQWAKEQDLAARRIALKEGRVDAVRKEIAALYCAFFVLHSLLLLLLLPLSRSSPSACRRSLAPVLVSASLSLSLVWAVRYKTDGEAHLDRLLRREREDSALLARCIEELKRKGLEFDLLKEVDALRRAKSLRVEAGGTRRSPRGRRWSPRDFGLVFLLAASCAVAWLTWFVLCK